MKALKIIQYARLVLYCDREARSLNCAHGNVLIYSGYFTGATFTEAAREAKKSGWKIHTKTQTATCPHCAKFDKRMKGK